MNIRPFLRNKQNLWNIIMWLLAATLVVIVLVGLTQENDPVKTEVDDGIKQIDLDKIYLSSSGVEVNFSDIILSPQAETRYLIVSTQTGTVSTELTDRLINKIDFDFLKKTQTVSYSATGYFAVDLHTLMHEDIVVDNDKKTITIKIGHAYLQAIDIDPNKIIIDEVKTGLLAWGDIELTMKDYNSIEKELRKRLEEKFDTVGNGQEADDNALKMVKAVYEPVVKAVDDKYDVFVEFK